jgi:site-specific DNA-cytosine methylase
MLALDELAMEVEKYYASEVHGDALVVSKVHFGNIIEQLGPVQELSPEKLSALGRIDLVIGGSPCTELSLANPLRKGLYGKYIFMYVFGKHMRELLKITALLLVL